MTNKSVVNTKNADQSASNKKQETIKKPTKSTAVETDENTDSPVTKARSTTSEDIKGRSDIANTGPNVSYE